MSAERGNDLREFMPDVRAGNEAAGAMPVGTTSQESFLTKPFVQLSLANFCFYSSVGLIFPLLPIHAANIGGSGVEVGLVVSLFAVAAIACRPFVGQFVDRGFTRRALLIGGSLYTACAAFYGLASALWILYSIRIVHGIGLSFFSTAAGTVLAGLAPRHRRGAAAGIFSSTQSLGMALPPALGVIIMQETSFSVAFALSALLALTSLVLSSRVRPPKIVQVRNVPLKLYSKSAFVPSAVCISTSLVHGAVTTFIPVMTLDKGMGNPGLFLTVYGLAIIVFRLLSGPISDRFGRAMVIAPGLLVQVVGTLYFSTIVDLLGIVVSAVVLGVAQGLGNPGLMALTIDRASFEERGSAVGTFLASFDIGVATGAVVAGIMIPYMGYSKTFATLALFPLLGLITFVWWRAATPKEPQTLT